MQNVVLGVHLLICVVLVGAVLMQRSEGGALGMGGGGSGGLISGRGAADLMVRITGFVAGAFFLTSVALTVMANSREGPRSVLDAVQSQPIAPIGMPMTAPAQPAAIGPERAGPATDDATGQAVAAPVGAVPAAASKTAAAPPAAAQKAPLGALRPTASVQGAAKTETKTGATPAEGAPLGAISPAQPGESGQATEQPPARPRVVGPDQ